MKLSSFIILPEGKTLFYSFNKLYKQDNIYSSKVDIFFDVANESHQNANLCQKDFPYDRGVTRFCRVMEGDVGIKTPNSRVRLLLTLICEELPV